MGKQFYDETLASEDTLRISINRPDSLVGIDPYNTEDGIYIRTSSDGRWAHAVLSEDEARAAAKALNDAADYHESLVAKNNRPKTFDEQTAHLGAGSLIAYKDRSWDLWLKTVSGWRGVGHNSTWEPSCLDVPGHWNLDEFVIRYAAPKEA